MGVTGAVGAGGAGAGISVVGSGRVVGGELSTWPVAAAEDGASAGFGVVGVWACAKAVPAKDVNVR
jgi:hypothetical protein